ncbi:MAG TPA: hypothetical protein VKB57_21180 [Acidimicrobiales bacterium]|nr:hypothetical protein [Acidimicrobiales bacterium]
MPALVTHPHANEPAVDARTRRAPAPTTRAGAPPWERGGICPPS